MHTHAVANYKHHKFFKIKFRIPKKQPIQPTSFGQFLKKLRLEKQLLQKDFAKLLSVDVQTIRNWERDRFLPKRESLVKLAEFFQVDKKTLLSFKL